jgi:hypothetical protein
MLISITVITEVDELDTPAFQDMTKSIDHFHGCLTSIGTLTNKNLATLCKGTKHENGFRLHPRRVQVHWQEEQQSVRAHRGSRASFGS